MSVDPVNWTESQIAALGERVRRDRPSKLAHMVEVRIESLHDQRALKSLGESGCPVLAAQRWIEIGTAEAGSIYFDFRHTLSPSPKIVQSAGIRIERYLDYWIGVLEQTIVC